MKDEISARLQVFAAALLSITAVCVEGHRFFPGASTTAAILLLLVVLVTGAAARLPEALLISGLAAAGLDYFFVPPIGSITVADAQGWVALTLFLITAVVASNISHRFRQQREYLLNRGSEGEKVHALGRSMLVTADPEELKRSAVNKCIELFGLRQAALFDAGNNRTYQSHPTTPISDESLRRVVRSGIDHHESDGMALLPLCLGNVRLGSIALIGGDLPQATLDGITNTLAVGLAQAQAQTAASHAEAVRRSEELKSVMIDALAHDFKSPLTSIEASAEMLQGGALTVDQRADLLAVIREEAHGLRRLIEEAIHLARIDADRLHLESLPHSVDNLVREALASLGDRVAGHQITVEVRPGLPSVAVDRDLLVQAIKQLLDNALKYSGAHSVIQVCAIQQGGEIAISVRDSGPGLTELEQSRIFDKFYRGRYDRSAIQGTGMGLSIAKEIVEAHGGRIRVNSQVGEGSEFSIVLLAERVATDRVAGDHVVNDLRAGVTGS